MIIPIARIVEYITSFVSNKRKKLETIYIMRIIHKSQ